MFLPLKLTSPLLMRLKIYSYTDTAGWMWENLWLFPKTALLKVRKSKNFSSLGYRMFCWNQTIIFRFEDKTSDISLPTLSIVKSTFGLLCRHGRAHHQGAPKHTGHTQTTPPTETTQHESQRNKTCNWFIDWQGSSNSTGHQEPQYFALCGTEAAKINQTNKQNKKNTKQHNNAHCLTWYWPHRSSLGSQ